MGPGSAPALRGPTRKPPADSHAIDPPPAPIVSTSITGRIRGWPSSIASRAINGLPSMHSETSKLVPPMSIAMALEDPARRARLAAAMAPPTGPERSVLTGCSRALAAVVMPPFDCMMWTLAATPRRRSSSSSSDK